jgi:hypothetical protein
VIYVKDAVAWDRFDPALPTFETLPERPTHVRVSSET